jgi:hypothetical protein
MMARTSFYETSFDVGSKTILVFAEYTLSGGCPAHMGSLTYPGHPAEPAELEFVKVEINTTDKDHKEAKAENFFPAPDWLVTILHEDDDIYQEICSQHDDYDDSYDYERD